MQKTTRILCKFVLKTCTENNEVALHKKLDKYILQRYPSHTTVNPENNLLPNCYLPSSFHHLQPVHVTERPSESCVNSSWKHASKQVSRPLLQLLKQVTKMTPQPNTGWLKQPSTAKLQSKTKTFQMPHPSLFHSQHTRQATCKNWVLFNPPKWHHRIYRARRPLLIQSSVLPIHVILGYLANPPLDIESLELVESSQHTSTSNTPEDVSSSTFHQRHESLRLDDLDSTVHGSLVLDGLTRGHHHTPTDGVNGVGDQPRSDGDNWKTVKTLEIFPMT